MQEVAQGGSQSRRTRMKWILCTWMVFSNFKLVTESVECMSIMIKQDLGSNDSRGQGN